MYEPRFFAPTPLGMACSKLFTAALAAAIAGDDSLHNKGPVGLGKYSTKKFSPLTSTGEIGENFLLAKFLSYTVIPKFSKSNCLCESYKHSPTLAGITRSPGINAGHVVCEYIPTEDGSMHFHTWMLAGQ